MEELEKLSSQLISQFRTDGVVVIRQCVSDKWLEALADAVEADIASPGPFFHGYQSGNRQGRFHGNLRMWEHDATFREFCFTSLLPGLATQLLESQKINLLYDQLFVKESNTPNRTRWHNDQPYWAIRGWQVLSFWIALDPVTEDSGALEFIPGSHRWDRWFQPESFGETQGQSRYEANPDYEPMPDIQLQREDYPLVSWDLEPGDAYAFHGLTVHGSGGNLKGYRRRRGYAVRYTGDDVVYDSSPGTNAHLRSENHSDGDLLDSERYPVVWPA